MEAISRFCGKAKKKQLSTNTSPSKTVKELRSLELTICDAHKLSTGKTLNQYCIVSLNDAMTCRTKPQEGQAPVWAEEFKFKYVFLPLIANRDLLYLFFSSF